MEKRVMANKLCWDWKYWVVFFHTHARTQRCPFEMKKEKENYLETSRLFSHFIQILKRRLCIIAMAVCASVCECRIAYRVAFRIPIPFRSNSFQSFQFTWNSILMNQIKSNALATQRERETWSKRMDREIVETDKRDWRNQKIDTRPGKQREVERGVKNVFTL